MRWCWVANGPIVALYQWVFFCSRYMCAFNFWWQWTKLQANNMRNYALLLFRLNFIALTVSRAHFSRYMHKALKNSRNFLYHPNFHSTLNAMLHTFAWDTSGHCCYRCSAVSCDARMDGREIDNVLCVICKHWMMIFTNNVCKKRKYCNKIDWKCSKIKCVKTLFANRITESKGVHRTRLLCTKTLSSVYPIRWYTLIFSFPCVRLCANRNKGVWWHGDGTYLINIIKINMGAH